MTLLIHGSHQMVRGAVDPQRDLFQVPRITGQRTPTPQLIGILLGELATSFADGLAQHDYPTDEQQPLYISVVEAEPLRPSDAAADDLGREAVVLVVGNGWCYHAATMAHHVGFSKLTMPSTPLLGK
jgi:hypothetical protein